MVLTFISNPTTIPPHFRCVHILENGEQCKHTPIKGKNKCWLHDGIKRTADERAKERERSAQNNFARNGSSLFYDERREMARSLKADVHKFFTEETIDWFLNWFKLYTEGTVEVKRVRLHNHFLAFDWNSYLEELDIKDLKKLGKKVFKLDFPNTSKKGSMITRLSVYLRAYYKGAADRYDIRNYNNAKRAKIEKMMKGNTPKNSKNSPKSKNNSSKKENKSKKSPAKKSKNSPKKKASAPKS